MKSGKVSQTVLKRSVLKPLQGAGQDLQIPLAPYETCGCIENQGELILTSSSTVYGNSANLAVYAMARAVNDLAARGAEALSVGLQILLPVNLHESRLRKMTEEAARAGNAHAVKVISADVQVSPVIETAVVSVHGMGVLKKEKLTASGMGHPGQEIVLMKWIGFEGSLRILDEKREELEKRFVPAFFHPVEQMRDEIFSAEAVRTAREYGAGAMRQIQDGGILAALWDLAEAADAGIQVDMKQMSIRQETVELCEFYHLNPYQLTSAGSMLMLADNGQELCEKLCGHGIQASVLGRLTEGREKVMKSQEEKRYLDRPAPDELVRLYEQP